MNDQSKIEVSIPLKGSDQYVEVPLEDVDDIIEMLISELPPLSLWTHIAVLIWLNILLLGTLL